LKEISKPSFYPIDFTSFGISMSRNSSIIPPASSLYYVLWDEVLSIF